MNPSSDLNELVQPHGWRVFRIHGTAEGARSYTITRVVRPRTSPSVMTALLLLAGATEVTRVRTPSGRNKNLLVCFH